MITSVTSPAANEIKTAYNPIIITAFSSGTVPVVYCDVYLLGVFYKTLVATSTVPGTSNQWEFDIRNVCQEALKATPPYFSTFLVQYLPQLQDDGLVGCTVKVRGSSLSGSFVVPDGPVPVQGTVDTSPVSGGGTTTPNWYVLNAALQLDYHHSPTTMMAQNNVGYVSGSYKIYNLFNNTRPRANSNDFYHLPVFIPSDGLPIGSLTMYIGIEWDNGIFQIMATTGPTTPVNYFFVAGHVYYIPAGRMNFNGLTNSIGTFTWYQGRKYRMFLTTNTDPFSGSFYTDIKWKSPWIFYGHPCSDHKRFRFANWWGQYDVVEFQQHEEEYRAASQGWQKFNIGNFNGRAKEAFGKMRFNVRSDELISATGYFYESDMPYLKQLISSPIVYIETHAQYGQADFMLPVRVLDVTAKTRKVDERFVYEITVQAETANEHINIRN